MKFVIGLVAARHLKHFGYEPVVVYPKPSRGLLFQNLVKQCADLDIKVFQSILQISDASSGGTSEKLETKFDCIVDAIFGFSFQGPVRDPFIDILQYFSSTDTPGKKPTIITTAISNLSTLI